MAVPIAGRANIRARGAVVNVVSPGGHWVDVNDNLETAQSATDLLNPAEIDDAVFRWVRIEGASNIILRGYITATGTVTTSPVVRVFGFYGDVNDDGTITFNQNTTILRLDNADNTAAGKTLTFDTLSNSASLNDNTNFYTDPTSLTPIDCLGASAIGVAVETAASISGSGTVKAQALIL